jgi:fructose-1,6-bisphosphatase
VVVISKNGATRISRSSNGISKTSNLAGAEISKISTIADEAFAVVIMAAEAVEVVADLEEETSTTIRAGSSKEMSRCGPNSSSSSNLHLKQPRQLILIIANHRLRHLPRKRNHLQLPLLRCL